MPKDLLAELNLPKLDLKNLQSIVKQNSARLSCLIEDSNEYLSKYKRISPGFKVVVGASNSDLSSTRNRSLPASEKNVKIIKRKYIVHKASRPVHNCFRNGIRKSPCSRIGNFPVSVSAKELNTRDKNNVKRIEIRPFRGPKCHSNSKISTVDVNRSSPVVSPGTCVEKNPSRDAVSSKPSDDVELEIVLDTTSKKKSDSNSPLNRSVLKGITAIEPPTELAVATSTKNDVLQVESTHNQENKPQPFCVISEVIGNADTAFSDEEGAQGIGNESQGTPLITPKKTNDITKIKGWRRKQFFVEKPTTIEFYSVPKGSAKLKKLGNEEEELNEDPGNVENAFVCDSLDEFLDREAELKIGYEIPHLYAEFGIRLTREEIVSKPKLTRKEVEEVEKRYCVPVSIPSDNLDDISEESLRKLKRTTESEQKPSAKMLKLDESSKEYLQKNEKEEAVFDVETDVESESALENANSNECSIIESKKNFSNIKLFSKLVALVVYPGPFKPLHPVVQYHLNKLRSFRTKVDKNWANFAASAVVTNNKRCSRRIVPAYCCVKMYKNPPVKRRDSSPSIREKIVDHTVNKEKTISVKPCSVFVKKLECPEMFTPWCMEHSCYHCAQCGLNKASSISKTKLPKQAANSLPSPAQITEEEMKQENVKPGETVTVSPRASFNKKIARLLAKKVGLLKAKGDTLTNINCLKVLKRNTIEFIKLGCVKKSFLDGRINIWYIGPETAAKRSRAFLTFSKVSPVPNAINLRSHQITYKLPPNYLPKVITEIISNESVFDSNEYAILHCNGVVWEIQGSLNITFGNSDKSVEQVFSSQELPELYKLQEIASEMLHVKAVKWWVLDLSQKFELLELKSGDISTVITRQKFSEVIKQNSFGFVPVRRCSESRIFGAYVIQRLLPFVLIGPYYLLETCDLILKDNASTVPFRYYGQKDVTSNYPLKFFINSIIKNVEKSQKTLEGIWLYDKMCLDRTAYIEIITSTLEKPLVQRFSNIDIEHGYSLNSLTYSSFSGAASGIVKRSDGKNELQTVTVYLYFDVFQLGYVEGELQFDNSVIIRHPLDERAKMKSHKIGDWFIRTIKRRLEFIPKDLAVKWFITKHKNDLKERLPFNKFYLSGAHVLTKNGILYLLETTESKIEKLGLSRDGFDRAMSKSELIKEVIELKDLARLVIPDQDDLRIDEILAKTVSEIKKLKKLNSVFVNDKMQLERSKVQNVSKFLKLIDCLKIQNFIKIKMIERIQHLLVNQNGELTKEFYKTLKMSEIGSQFINQMNQIGIMKDYSVKSKTAVAYANRKSYDCVETDNFKRLIFTIQKQSENINSILKSTSCAESCNYSDNVRTANDSSTKLNSKNTESHPVSSRLYCSETKDLKDEKSSDSVETVEEEPHDVVNVIVENEVSGKKEGFLNLTSSELPGNIKMSWENWNVNKLEVA